MPVTIRNFGGNDLDTLQVQWSINGVLQSTYFFGDTLTPENSTTIFLDPFNFQFPQNYTVKVWTTNPNNQTDAQTFNDTTTITFTPNPVYQVNQAFTLCDGETVNVGGTTYNATGIYIDTLNTIEGCDSIVITDLTVNALDFDTLQATICSSETYLFGGSQLNTTGIYNDTLTNENGCDSIVTLNLTVNSLSFNTLDVEICNNQTYDFNGNILSTTGNYSDTLTNATGCDSVVTLNLTVNPVAATTIDTTICSNENFLAGGTFHSTAGTYNYNLQTWKGCDSTVTLNLAVKPVARDTLVASICSGENFEGYLTTGFFTDVFVANNGCDSLRFIDLTVFNLPSPSIQQLNDSTLQVNASSAYQWYFNGSLLPNDTNQTIVPTASGNYSVLVTNANGCSAQSTDFQFFVVSSGGIDLEKEEVQIIPNPNRGTFNLSIKNLASGKWFLQIYNAKGQLVHQANYGIHQQEAWFSVRLDEAASGLYFLRLMNEKGVSIDQSFLINK